MLDDVVKRGMAPNIARLISEGAAGRLRSTVPFATAPAWTTFMTGKNPGKNGVFDFVQLIPGTYQTTEFDTTLAVKEGGVDLSVMTSKQIAGTTIWDILTKVGMKMVVVHVPMTFPPTPVNGVMITGLGTPGPSSAFTHPKQLRERLLNEMGYSIHAHHLDVEGIEQQAFDDLCQTEEKRLEVALTLLHENDWDFAMVVFEGTDYVQHFFWKYADPSHPLHRPQEHAAHRDLIRRYYQKADSMIGRLLSSAPDANVLIMSDHGGGPLRARFCVNEWLCELGLIELSAPGPIVRTLRRLGVTKEKLYPLAVRLDLGRLVQRAPGPLRNIVPAQGHKLSEYDWKRTKAFGVSGWGMIYINVQGRHPMGCVDPGDEYRSTRQLIAERAKELRLPDGSEVSVDVHLREDLYWGEKADLAPDLVIRMEGVEFFEPIREGRPHGSLFIEPLSRKTGTHRPEGILVLSGPSIRREVKIEGAGIQDLAPTILYLLGIPVPRDMDGKILRESILPTLLMARPVEYSEALRHTEEGTRMSSEEEEIVKERLRGLGYID